MAELEPKTVTVVEPKQAAETPKTTTTISESSVMDKARKGEELTDRERELIKGIPPGATPSDEAITEAIDEDEPNVTEVPQAEETVPEVVAVVPKEVTADRRELIEQELAKPDSQVDLSKFKSPIELGLYWDLRKARVRNSKLQEENEVLRIERIVKDIQAKPKEVAAVEVDPFEGRDPEDIMTVADFKKILQSQKQAPQAPPPLRTTDQLRMEKVEAESRLRSKGITDFYDVVDFAEQVLGKDEEAITILRDTAKSGGNVAEKTYWLIKGHPAWEQVDKIITDEKNRQGQTTPKKELPKENTERAERIVKNSEKVRTTGTGSGSNGNAREYSVGEIASMTSADLRKMPKETRQAILKKYGSAPNQQI